VLSRRQFLRSAASAPLVARARAADSRWNLLILTNDQHRADCLGCYGNPIIQTPNTDRLAAQGVRIGNAFVHAPQCVPSRFSLHTGGYPHTTGVFTNSVPLPDDVPTRKCCSFGDRAWAQRV
jgi:arylsulfatase A-like enzyme